jgi:hypothetical protein
MMNPNVSKLPETPSEPVVHNRSAPATTAKTQKAQDSDQEDHLG